MKLKFSAHMMLIDCGKASKMTRGVFGGFFEAGNPPYTHRD